MKIAILLAAFVFSPLAYAADSPAPPPRQQSAMIPGEVRKVDKEQGKITIRHEPLINLDMPAMTMVFRAKDPSMLDNVKEGDKIRFTAERIDGAITIVQWEPDK